ncbi:uncharacterized protein LOC143303495 isoform X1 [Bombus vancouverensis nearcticus]|uniref:uncharacterized protein LOC143303495 isoform X1 n=1 Tax=Bombus vancouverensis nearcticus TaxID=2705178 RepID=UPI00402BDD03
MSKDKAGTGRNKQSIEVSNHLQEQITQVQRRLDLLAQQTNGENKQRVKKIEILGRTVTKIKVGLNDNRATLMTEDFESVHDDTLRRTRPSAPETESDDDDVRMQPRNTREPLLTAEKAVKHIPILNGDDDIGVEDFIADVRAIRNLCSQKALLLRPLKTEKIIGRATQ